MKEFTLLDGKVCIKCCKWKFLSEFSFHKWGYLDRRADCKQCFAEDATRRRRADPDKARKIDQRFREKNRQKLALAQRDRRKANPEKYRMVVRQWRETNKDREREQQRESAKTGAHYQWVKANPQRQKDYQQRYREVHAEQIKERYRERTRNLTEEQRLRLRNATINRRARLKGADGHHTVSEWKELCSSYGNKCLCCGCTDCVLSEDHIVPISKGGSNDISNIQPLCMPCNLRKADKTIDYRSDHEVPITMVGPSRPPRV